MVGVAVGRSGDELVGEVEPSQGVHRGHFEGVAQVKIGKETRNTLGKHGLADARRAVEKHVMPTGSSYLTSPLSLRLTGHICKIKPALGMLACRVAHDLNRIHQRHRLVS